MTLYANSDVCETEISLAEASLGEVEQPVKRHAEDRNMQQMPGNILYEKLNIGYSFYSIIFCEKHVVIVHILI